MGKNMFRPRRRIPRWIRLGLCAVCGCVGLMLSWLPQQFTPEVFAQRVETLEIRTVPPHTTTDPVPPNLVVGQSLYLQHCGSCHIAIPPAVFPSQTWDQIVLDRSHYGAVIEPLLEPEQTWMRRYLRFASRTKGESERTPYRFRESRYFKALHPEVAMPSTITAQTCITCHAKASEFNFRFYSPEAQLAPSID